MKNIFYFILLLTPSVFAQPRHATIQQQVSVLTETMVHDIVNPPAAARFYSYALLTGFEILSQLDKSLPRIQAVLNKYPEIQISPVSGIINKELAVLYGILETGKRITPSGDLIGEKQNQLVNQFIKRKFLKKVIDSSIVFAQKISNEILAYSQTDGYFNLSTLQRYTPVESEGMWQPTPPEYLVAVEPYWKSIRLFFLDSSQQFKPAISEKFDKDSSSAFYKLTREVYDVSKHLTEKQKLIANFWDCNPFAIQSHGHMSIGLKKISPGGHWMSITGIVCKQARLDFAKTILLHTIVALTIHDAFVSCWDEKYRSNRIRPETVINRYIDQEWKPVLQTPPFPEYPSGHSVISTAAAEILTYFLGTSFSFIDSTETYLGLPPRKFSNFRKAADEACISRLYGGIHFRDAIEHGAEQGRQVGFFVIKKIKLNTF